MERKKEGVAIRVGMIRKPVLCVLTTALAAVSLYTAPSAGANHVSAYGPLASVQAKTVVPVPMQVSKGVQQLVRLVPELGSRYVVNNGEVDGPGVSGVSVSFALSSKDADTATDYAVFDSQTGNLLVLQLAPKSPEKPAVLTEQQLKAKASAFVAGLQSPGNGYLPREIIRIEERTTVRMVRKINNVALDDGYDAFVSFDNAGRIVAFQTFNGKLHEKINVASLPSAQRVLSAQQANLRFQESRPLELVYLLPGQIDRANTVEAKLAFVVKDGMITQDHTGSALDAVSGKRLLEPSGNPKPSSQTINLNGTGEKWLAQTDAQARDLVRMLFRLETGKLPLVTFVEKQADGQERRLFIWGHFREGATDQEKQYEIGQFPEKVSANERRHILLETDEKTGRLIRFVTKEGEDVRVKTDKKRDMAAAEALLKRLVPTGGNQMVMKDMGSENHTFLTVDPLINGIPVYREGQMDQEGMYTVLINSRTGAIEEVTVGAPASLVVPSTSKAISEKEAVNRLLKAFPLELTYNQQTVEHTGATTWKLAYDLSFRQTRSHCFCGGESKVDLTVRVDGLTGEVIVKE